MATGLASRKVGVKLMTGLKNTAMAERRSSYDFDDLLTCGHGHLFGAGNAQLPLPPMLMFDRISHISDAGGPHGKGQVVANLAVAGNARLDWFFKCHFEGDPVMPGCLGLDALWQLTGFFLGWLGAPGRGGRSAWERSSSPVWSCPTQSTSSMWLTSSGSYCAS